MGFSILGEVISSTSRPIVNERRTPIGPASPAAMQVWARDFEQLPSLMPFQGSVQSLCEVLNQ